MPAPVQDSNVQLRPGHRRRPGALTQGRERAARQHSNDEDGWPAGGGFHVRPWDAACPAPKRPAVRALGGPDGARVTWI